MSQQDLEYAEERLEGLADQVWRAATEETERKGG